MSKAIEPRGAFRLLKLELRNFKGQRSFTLTPDGASFSIWADNEIGKTTIADAYFWLLLDKDSLGRKDFGIKTIDSKTEQPIKGLDHTVYGRFQIGDDILELEKTYKEDWTKKRGGSTAEFSGHTTDYKVNGVPVKKSDYEAKIRQYFDEKTIRLFGDPTYFPSVMHWQDRRKLILEMCGTVTDAEVIKRNRKLADLPEILGNRSIDELRAIIDGKKKVINQEIARIPIRIDELTRAMPPESEPAPDVEPIRAQLRSLQENRARTAAGGAIADKNVALQTIRGQIIEARARAKANLFADSDGIRAELHQLNLQISDRGSKIDVLGFSLQGDWEALNEIDQRLGAMRAQYIEEKGRAFEWKGSDICASCGQALPAGNIAEARTKAEEAFNAQKAEKLEANMAQGQALKARRAQLAEKIKGKETELADLHNEMPILEQHRDQLALDLDAALAAPTTDSKEVTDLEAQAADLEETISTLKASTAAALADLDARIADLETAIGAAEQAAARAKLREESEVRLAELEAQERSYAAELEKLERELFLTEEFIRTKVKALEEKINARFTIAKFRLFETQVNGAIAECCEVTVDGVPYGDLNHAAKINVGLDCINTLSDHFGFAPPVWVDNAESVTKLLPVRGQQIKLVVSEPDKALRVVLDRAA